MSEKENYLLYSFVNQMINEGNYELLHINEQINEIWLQKDENKTSKVIRMTSQGFDWTNQLKRDITQVFQKAKALKKYLYRKKVEISNIYLTEFTPVDEWEKLKQPLLLKEKNPVRMNVYYLAEDNFSEEKQRLETNLNLSLPEMETNLTEEKFEIKIAEFKQELVHVVKKQRQEEEDIFSFGKPRFIYGLLVINIILFFMLEANGGSESIETLIKYGAIYNPAMLVDGEWWRAISAMFLHIGFFHLLMNMVAVYYLGSLVERIYGSGRFIIIYFLAGIGGSLASFAFTMNVSAGASGALFGLFGALLFFGLIHKRLFFNTIGMNIIILVAINIIFGMFEPQIDNSAHMGGLVTGFFAAGMVSLPTQKQKQKKLLYASLYTILLVGFVVYGIYNNQNDVSYQLAQVENFVDEREYEEAIEVATEALKQPDEYEAYLLFQRSYAHIKLEKLDLAITDLERSVQLEDSNPESFYNLALLYEDTNQHSEAIEAIEIAYELDDSIAYKRLYEEITGETVPE